VSSIKFLLGCLGATLLAGLIAGPFSVDSTSTRAYAFTKTAEYRPSAWLTGADRFPSGAQIQVVTPERQSVLVPAFAGSADAAVSFDGKYVLFSGKPKPASRWQVWEVALEGGNPRQITSGAGDCIKPLYLPDDRIVYTRTTLSSSTIEVVPATGGSPEPLTFAPGRYLTNDVLFDGRILFEAQRVYQGGTVRELYTAFPDGTGVESLRCDHGGDRHAARQVSTRDVLFVQAGRLSRFTSALAQQTRVEQPDGEFGGAVSESAPGQLLVSIRTPADQRYSIYAWNGASKKLMGFANADAVDPVAITSRNAPRRFPSALMPSRAAANLLCLNAHTTRDAAITKTIQSVRVYTQDAGGKAVILGQTPVERDGSFYVQLPGEKPLRMELLDGSGQVIRAEKNWFWMRTGEQRVCVGCHTGPERAPDNDVPEVLRKTIEPVKMLTGSGRTTK
jgi:hypothetical protein